MADEQTARAMMKASGFDKVEMFERIDADICIGTALEEAINYQTLVGPSGELAREKLPLIRQELKELMTANLRENGVYMPSSTWAIVARK
jgi:hypothetical protein